MDYTEYLLSDMLSLLLLPLRSLNEGSFVGTSTGLDSRTGYLEHHLTSFYFSSFDCALLAWAQFAAAMHFPSSRFNGG